MAVVGYPIPERKVATISASFTLWIRMTIPVPESRGSPKPSQGTHIYRLQPRPSGNSSQDLNYHPLSVNFSRDIYSGPLSVSSSPDLHRRPAPVNSSQDLHRRPLSVNYSQDIQMSLLELTKCGPIFFNSSQDLYS